MHVRDLLEAEQRGLDDGADRRADPPALEVTLVALDLQACDAVGEPSLDTDQRRVVMPSLAMAAS